MGDRGGVVLIAWTHVSRRQQEIAHDLGADLLIAGGRDSTRTAVGRYLVASFRTVSSILRERPRVVIATLPPIPLGLIVISLSRLVAFQVVLDSHPGAFGLMGDTLSRRLQPLHRFLLKRARYVAVTTEALVKHVEDLGGRAGVLHEPPPLLLDKASIGSTGDVSNFVLFPGSGGRDEPYLQFFRAAALLPEIDFIVTGEVPVELKAVIPDNVKSVGWVNFVTFEELMASAKIVVVLSTERESVMRTAYEACYRCRPLVVSRTENTQKYFPFAVHVANNPEAIAEGVKKSALYDSQRAANQQAFVLDSWRRQVAMLLESFA